MIIEQTVSTVPDHPQVFKFQYRITHSGADQHAQAGQEFPAIWVNRGFERLVYYGGTVPWTGGSETSNALPQFGEATARKYISEHWAALVNNNDLGLTVFAPGSFPYVNGFVLPGDSGTKGFGAVYAQIFTPFSIGPNVTISGEFYIILGDYKKARQSIYSIRQTTQAIDISAPIGFLDAPQVDAQVSGTIAVDGWAYDNVAVSKVEVFVDSAFVGTATYGSARPDIHKEFPGAPDRTGYNFRLDTTRLPNGPHVVRARAYDSSGNSTAFQAAVSIRN